MSMDIKIQLSLKTKFILCYSFIITRLALFGL